MISKLGYCVYTIYTVGGSLSPWNLQAYYG